MRTWSDEDLIKALEGAISLSEVLRRLNLVETGSNRGTLRRHMTRLGLIAPVYTSPPPKPRSKRNLLTVFTENSRIQSSKLSVYLKRSQLLPYICSEIGCANPGIHNGKPLVLQVDHISGDGKDNRLENLRWLCPNCHTQTPTFAGKSSKRRISLRPPRTCTMCKSDLPPPSKAKFCKICLKGPIFHKPLIDWPEDDVIRQRIEVEPLIFIAKSLGVSESSLIKRCRNRGISTKGFGYWRNRKKS